MFAQWIPLVKIVRHHGNDQRKFLPKKANFPFLKQE